MQLLQTFFLFLVLLPSAALHLQNHMTLNQNLAQLQNIVQMKTEAIDHQINEVLGKLPSENDLVKKIELVEDLIVRQRNNIIGILQTTAFDLDESKWTCEAFGPTQESGLREEEKQVKEKMKLLAGSIEQALPGHPAYSIVSVLDSASSFVSSEKSALESKGKGLPSNTIKNNKRTNFNAGHWALGKTTLQVYKQSLEHQGNTFVQFCPFYKPFANNNGSCVQCPASRPYWLLSDSTCISCPKYDPEHRQCQTSEGHIIISGGFFTNFKAASGKLLLLKGQQLSNFNQNYEKLPVCPVDKPFFNSTDCISCPDSLYFSLSDRSCRTCPNGEYHDSVTCTCKQQFYYSKITSHSWSTSKKPVEDILESISIQKSKTEYAECPPNQPYSLGNSCISCPKPTHFSYDTMKCQTCPKGTILNLNMHRCHEPGNLNFQTNPINTTNLIYNGQSQQEWLNRYYLKLSNSSGVTDCSPSEPYFDGTACIQCPKSSPYFNLETLICQQCQGTTLYSSNKRECLSSDSNRAVQTPSWQKMAAAVLA